MKLASHAMVATILAVTCVHHAAAEYISGPTGTPNIPGCNAPRSWTMKDGRYQCLLPPPAPPVVNPPGGNLTDADLAHICSIAANNKGIYYDYTNGGSVAQDVFEARDRTPGGSFATTALHKNESSVYACMLDQWAVGIAQCWINAAGVVQDLKYSYDICGGG